MVLYYDLLKFWVLDLNYECPNKCVFYSFYGFICDSPEFPSLKSSKIFTAHRIQWDTDINAKNVGLVQAVFSIFANLCFTSAKKRFL